MTKIILNVKGMVCYGCENRVENSLKNIEGVKKVKANYQKGSVQITANEEISRTMLIQTLENLGYEVEKEA